MDRAQNNLIRWALDHDDPRTRNYCNYARYSWRLQLYIHFEYTVSVTSRSTYDAPAARAERLERALRPR